MYMNGWVPSLFTWICRNTVNWLDLNTKYKVQKKTRLKSPNNIIQ